MKIIIGYVLLMLLILLCIFMAYNIYDSLKDIKRYKKEMIFLWNLCELKWIFIKDKWYNHQKYNKSSKFGYPYGYGFKEAKTRYETIQKLKKKCHVK